MSSTSTPESSPESSPTSADPFAETSPLPYQLPPFDQITDAHFLPAFEAAMAEHRAEVEAIAGSDDPPTYENTIVALERAGRRLGRVSLVFDNIVGSGSTPAIQEIEAEVAPKRAAHSDAILLDRRLYRRVAALYDRRDELELDPQQAWLLERYHKDFVRAGARLSDADAERLKQLNTELSSLTSQFSRNLLGDTNELAVRIDDVAELAGLSDDAIAGAAKAAEERGLSGSYLIDLRLPTAQPALADLSDPLVRERLHAASIARGSRGNDHDNAETVLRIVRLRAEQAELLGYRDHASYMIDDTTAGSVEAVADLLARVAPAAVANARREAAERMDERRQDGAVDVEGGGDGGDGDGLAPWDWAYYADRLRCRRYDIDAAALRPYFEMNRVLIDGVFFAAGRLYGLEFAERHDLPTPFPGVRTFEVFDGPVADGNAIGLFLADLYTRDTKRGGAWASSFVRQSHLHGTRPVIQINLNLDPPAEGKPTLLTFDEVRTLFHEFGHALHGLFSDVTFPRVSGTSVPRDFVEYPSQVNEMWALWPEVLANYAVHIETGEPLPPEVVDRLLAARAFDEGFRTTEYVAATLLDQAWHRLTAEEAAEVTDVAAFEATALTDAGVAVPAVPPRYRTTYFAHAFGGPGYSARYYSYIWSEVLDADTVEWFEGNGGLRRENGDRFRTELLSKGGSLDVMDAYRTFRGSDPNVEHLLKRRGLTTPD